MCARFSLYATPAQIAELLEVDVPEVEAHYNIAPTETVLGAIEKDGKRQVREFRWGLIPSWAKDASIGNRMINARSETLLEKSSFRTAFQRRRCVIPANGFFEWKHETVEPPAEPTLFEGETTRSRTKGKPKILKQPYFITVDEGAPFVMAGLYEYWRDPKGELVRSCTILTTRSNELIAPLHDRMPVILEKKDIEGWLNCEHVDPATASALLEPLSASEMRAVPVSTAANDPNNKSARILERTV